MGNKLLDSLLFLSLEIASTSSLQPVKEREGGREREREKGFSCLIISIRHFKVATSSDTENDPKRSICHAHQAKSLESQQISH